MELVFVCETCWQIPSQGSDTTPLCRTLSSDQQAFTPHICIMKAMYTFFYDLHYVSTLLLGSFLMDSQISMLILKTLMASRID